MVIETYQNKNLAYYIKLILGLVEFILLNGFHWKKDELIVLNLHSTPKKLQDNFDIHLRFLQKNFNIINPSVLLDHKPIVNNSKKPSLLLTFDDGLKNNLYAVETLKKYNLQALFFIVPKFVESSLKKDGRQYYLDNIRPVVNPKFDHESEDFESVSWDEIKELVDAGNSIGSHTMSHLLSADMLEAELQYEIVESKKHIEEKTGFKAVSFCSPNNTVLSVSSEAEKIIDTNYKFHFTTYHGSNSTKKIPRKIKRINIESFWDLGVVKFALGRIQNRRIGV
ncbi:MAG: hypothetical protein CL840_05960 [Crocinitomicaceae bacterium]|nr:hypothetical protein [Crocinitomicaceae bacterium]|tara:strand:- start:5822 stop:6664 length:843 start_codon:yes stop_codon:yes gene_type:complete